MKNKFARCCERQKILPGSRGLLSNLTDPPGDPGLIAVLWAGFFRLSFLFLLLGFWVLAAFVENSNEKGEEKFGGTWDVG